MEQLEVLIVATEKVVGSSLVTIDKRRLKSIAGDSINES